MNDDLRVPLRYSGQDRQWPRSKPVFTVLALSLALVTGAGEFAFQYKTSWTALQRYYLSTYVQTAHLVETRNRYPRPSRTYRILRHPGYGAMIFVMPVTAIALGSRLALAPALLYSALIIRRTMEEDHFLKSKLPGYVSYAGRVRYRLFPGSLMKGGFDHAMSQMPLRGCRQAFVSSRRRTVRCRDPLSGPRLGPSRRRVTVGVRELKGQWHFPNLPLETRGSASKEEVPSPDPGLVHWPVDGRTVD